MNKTAADILMHVGVSKKDGAPIGSGRYPLGSGENPYQHWKSVTARVQDLKDKGMTEKQIAEVLFNDPHATTTKLRTYLQMERDEGRSWQVSRIEEMSKKGMTPTEIARELGYKSESSVRSLLNQRAKANNEASRITAEYLEKVVKAKGMVDVGAGVESELGVSKEKLKTALEILKLKGYEIYGRGVPQVTNPGQQTNIQVLCPPGTKFKDIYNTEKIHSVSDYDEILTDDGQKIRPAFTFPASLDSKRLKVRYAEEGGIDKDGVIELRRNVADLDLGNSNYAQVRILVNGTHYLKGMAVYSDKMPEGVDVIFNTNKKVGTPLEKTLKPIKDDPDNPFGSLIKEKGGQYYYTDPKTGKEKLGLINKAREEGEWGEWSKELPSQFLAKQPKELIKKQLDVTANERYAEFEKIMSLTNPTIKKKLLYEFANECDGAAVHLKAASLPGQRYQVILPIKNLKDTECYAPNYKDGQTVALIRYPHASITEIPILKVNNKNPEGKKVIGANALDAIGINKNVADRLSGADFDGDTVQVIPLSRNLKVKNKEQFPELVGFDIKQAYGPDSTNLPYKILSKENTQKEMGRVSNLITDMTLKGADDREIAKALKHSMVIIDANKHELDWKRSEKDNDIAALRKRYQGRIENERYTESASTLISRAKGETSVVKRKGSPQINQKGKSWYDPSKPEGALLYKEDPDAVYEEKVKVRKTDPKTGKYLKDPNGGYVYETTPSGKPVWAPTGGLKVRTQRSTQMAETDDARKLSSGTIQENLYADYANKMKALANRARKEMVYSKGLEYHRSAAETYKKEVDSLDSKLMISEKNAPREREAQRIALVRTQAKVDDNPHITKEEKKKIAQQEIVRARALVGAERASIQITDREWEAIQAGAISDTKLTRILKHVDTDKLRERATPRENKGLSSVQVSLLKSMKNAGYTNAAIAERLGVSSATVSKYL